MLTAATTALLSGQAIGATCSTTSTTNPSTATFCDITTEITSPIATATVNTNPSNVTIDTDGSLQISTSPPTAPAITINSNNYVTNTTNITYTGVSYSVGTLLEEAGVPATASVYGSPETWTGEFVNTSGTINLTGSGTNKTGILIAGAAFAGSAGVDTNATTGVYANTSTSGYLGAFTGETGFSPSGGTTPVAINLAAGSVLEVQGTSSYGINLIAPTYTTSATGQTTPSGGGTLIGNIDIGGSVTLTPTTVNTSATSNVAVNIAGWMQSAVQPYNPALPGNQPYAMVGNVDILPGGVVSSEGQGSQGLVVLGAINGGIINSGELQTYGTSTPSTATNADDPEASSALVIANNVIGGIYNDGPTSAATGTARASIAMTGDAYTIDISPSFNQSEQVPITIGKVASDADYPNQFSLLNRGGITASAEDGNISTTAIYLYGPSSAYPVTLSGGIFNSGTISASATTNVNEGTTTNATSISIGQYVMVNPGTAGTTLVGPTTAALINSNETGAGTIAATVSGDKPGEATAIAISPLGTLASVFNSGTISATATTTDTTTILAR
jgi:hypothetical protein